MTGGLAVGIEADVVEVGAGEVVKGDAFQIAGRDDAVGIDVVAWDVNGGSGDRGDFWERHGDGRFAAVVSYRLFEEI